MTKNKMTAAETMARLRRLPGAVDPNRPRPMKIKPVAPPTVVLDGPPLELHYQRPDGVVFHIRHDGRVVGMMKVGVEAKPVMELSSFWVHEDEQNLGFGGAAVGVLFALAKEAGFDRIVGRAAPKHPDDFPRLRRFYRREGFVLDEDDYFSIDLATK